MVQGGIPSSWNWVTSPTQISSRLSNGMMAAVSATSTQIDLSSGSRAACSQLEESITVSMLTKWGPIEEKEYVGRSNLQVFVGT